MSTEQPNKHVRVKMVTLKEILDLRREVFPEKTIPLFSEDAYEMAIHVAAFDINFSLNQPVACASFVETPFRHRLGWQFYAVGTREQHRRQGLLRRILTDARPHLANRSGFRFMWCSAPVSLIPIFEKLGGVDAGGYTFFLEGTAHRTMLWEPGQ